MRIRSTAVTVALLPALLLLSACTPTPAPQPSETAAVPSESATPEVPTELVAADYLVEDIPAEENANELFHYAFYTDDAHTTLCDVLIGGQQDPFLTCFIMADAESQVTYEIPAGGTPECESFVNFDGYEVLLDSYAGDGNPHAFITGCHNQRSYPTAEIDAATKVLPADVQLVIDPFTCTQHDGVATCALNDGPYVTIGLSFMEIYG